MERIISNINHHLLHIVVRSEDIAPGRVNLIDDYEFLQCALLNLPKGTTFKPHQHKWKGLNQMVIAQESWVVISGKVKCIFYDLDGTLLKEVILNAGDASFTLQGGHNYEILEEGTKVLEYKTGPYTGQQADKKFI